MHRISLMFLAASCTLAGTALAWPRPEVRAALPVDYRYAAAHGAFLLIHTFTHDQAAPLELRGTAEGLVNGARRSVALQFVPDGTTPGRYLVLRTWPAGGVWVLNITGHFYGDAGMLVGIGRDGVPTTVRTPTEENGRTRAATPAEVDELLAALTAGATHVAVAPRSRGA